MANAAGSRHPTGMHSCFNFLSALETILSITFFDCD